MSDRIFVQKKHPFTTERDNLLLDLQENLNLKDVQSLDIYNVYDVFNSDEEDVKLLKEHVLSEKQTDLVFDDVNLSGNA